MRCSFSVIIFTSIEKGRYSEACQQCEHFGGCGRGAAMSWRLP